MTTPEKIAEWSKEAKFAYGCDNKVTTSSGPYSAYIAGYLRVKQETEQAIKDARKQAIEDCANFAKDWAMEHVIEDDATLAVGDYITKSMEALND